MIKLPDTLEAVRGDLVQRWARGKADRRSPFHTPVVGGGDDLRTMVLRAFDPASGAMRFHTDIRAAKSVAFAAPAPATVLGYDPQARIQIRARGTARIEHRTPAADAAWAASSLSSRRCYLAPLAPGTVSPAATSGLPQALEGRVPTIAESEQGRDNFAILLFSPESFEWLHLAARGHRRARFAIANGVWRGEWLVP